MHLANYKCTQFRNYHTRYSFRARVCTKDNGFRRRNIGIKCRVIGFLEFC